MNRYIIYIKTVASEVYYDEIFAKDENEAIDKFFIHLSSTSNHIRVYSYPDLIGESSDVFILFKDKIIGFGVEFEEDLE